MYLSRIAVNKKIISIVCVTLAAFFVISARLFYLQICCVDYFSLRSEKNFIRREAVDSLRGNIRDIHGNFLATNRPVACLLWQGTGNWRLSEEQQKALQLIEGLTNNCFTDGEAVKKIIKAEKKKQKVVLLSDIDFTLLSKLSEIFPTHENIIIDMQFKRFYPYGRSACHVVGYLGNIHVFAHGQLGLEKIFDTSLCGKKGSNQHIVNSVGQRISQENLEKALSGDDVQTTIDIDMQLLCEKVFPEKYQGCFILFNPLDGAVVSVASRPNFDPNIFLDPISFVTWQTLQEGNPFLNRAFDAHYPSGSIFKLVTISAALEQGFVAPDMVWDCKGYTLFGKRKYWCAHRCGHGEITIKQALAQSCNTLFFEIGKQVDIDLLAQYAYKFGLGAKTNIIFPEKSGLVPNRAWKMNCKGERWWPGETLSVTIGQSFSLATPIQVARMIGGIFTGHLVSPRLLLNEPIITTALDIQSATINFLKKSMKMVVRHGTGRSVREVKDIKIYAKTSTAQTSDFNKRKLDQKYLEHGWFVGYFQYKDYDPLVMVLLIEHAGTAQVATKVAKNFLVEYKKYRDILYEA